MRHGTVWRDAMRWVCTAAVAVAVGAGLAYAKLPQAPLDDAAKAKAEEAKAKAAAATKSAREAEEKAMDRVAAHYKKEKGVKTSTTAPAPASKKK